jgi:rhodanese-related sulfurtransferase
MATLDDTAALARQEQCARSAAQYSQQACGSAFPRITAAEAAAAAAAKEQPMILVDVRTANEQAVGMIPGALTQEAFEVRFATPESLPAGAIVAPYCTIGYRSGRYAAQLAAKGFPDVRNHEGVLMHTHIGALVTPLKTDVGGDQATGNTPPGAAAAAAAAAATSTASSATDSEGRQEATVRRVHTYAYPWSGMSHPSFEEVQYGAWELAQSLVGRGPAVRQ